jgi:thioredoxin-like negative regulator of GroEL
MLLLHSATIRVAIWRASAADDLVTVPYEVALAGGPVSAQQVVFARRALDLYTQAWPVGDGGWALVRTPAVEYRTAWLLLVLGDKSAAMGVLARMEATGRDADTACIQRARILESEQRGGEAVAALEDGARRLPRNVSIRQELALALFRAGRTVDAIAELKDAAEVRPGQRVALERLADEMRHRAPR